MIENDFLEVETPMLHNIPGGATARPFITYHNEINKEMYLRIAPELYLKQLIIGGFERIFELNRNFRNEGVSARHNPEFTMMEAYMVYSNYKDMMNFTENLIKNLIKLLFEKSKV
jgi:lysyl-tRNA synthetase class 2